MMDAEHLIDNQNKLSQILLMGMEEVMGAGQLDQLLLRCGFPPLKHASDTNHLDIQIAYQDLAGIRRAIEKEYGPRSGRGLALRAGSESFKYGLRLFGQEAGLLDMRFRLQPTSAKIRTGLTSMSTLIGRISHSTIHLEEKANHFIWQMDPCPLCWQEPSGGISCPSLIGLLQEFLNWASGGKRYQVIDIQPESLEKEPRCSLFIDKYAFD